MLRRLIILLALLALGIPGVAAAFGGDYVFAGGTDRQQSQVRLALDASSFDWSIVPQRITVHIAPGTDSFATPGDVWLDADLLDAGRFSWATTQHEFAHQVDFFVLDDAMRATLRAALGATDWCSLSPGLEHGRYACERFASLVSWAYWPSSSNALRPRSKSDEAGALPPTIFRTLLARLLRPAAGNEL